MSIKVDLKAQEVKKGMGFDYGWIVVIMLALIAFGLFYSWGLKLEGDVKRVQAQTADVEKEIANYNTVRPAIERLRREVGVIESQIKQLKELRYDPLKYSILLVELSSYVPSGTWVKSLTLDPGKGTVALQGTAVASGGKGPLHVIADFIKKIQGSQHFAVASVSQISAVELENTIGFDFNLECPYHISIAELKGSESR